MIKQTFCSLLLKGRGPSIIYGKNKKHKIIYLFYHFITQIVYK